MGCFAMVCGKEQQKCHKKETRIKREGKFEEKHKLGFLSRSMLNTGYGALLEIKQDELPIHCSLRRPLQMSSPGFWPEKARETYANSFQIIVRAKSCVVRHRSMYLSAHIQMSHYHDNKQVIYLLSLLQIPSGKLPFPPPHAIGSILWGRVLCCLRFLLDILSCGPRLRVLRNTL